MKTSEIRKKFGAEDIRIIENKHGTVYFRMALYHLFDVGHRNITDESVAETKDEIMAEQAYHDGNGIPIMTPEFQCHLLDIALELSRFSMSSLLAYVKTDLAVG